MTQPQFPADGQDLYAILGIPSDADSDQVTRAFRTRLRALHPDTASDTGTQAAEALEAVLSARHVLHNPVRRTAYDRARTPGRPKPPCGYLTPQTYCRDRSVSAIYDITL
jgi:curved DNA-binding protein CbpA